ncbi:MAG TPA: septum formation initiator family protein [Bacteroidota bacterium]|nr:septum formation initiator family protein [Bacteroidota bacterium]
MEDQFYRAIPTPRHFFKRLLKKAVKNKKRTSMFILAFMLATYLLFDNKGVIARVRLESQKKDLEQKIVQAETETKSLQAQIKALEGDKKTIEKIAREKYGMARNGETVYRVKKD